MNPTIKHLITLSNDGDTWGDAMGAFFSIANAWYLNGGMGMASTYAPWGLRPSPLLRDDEAYRDEDPMMAELLTLLDDGEITMADLHHAGDVLNRYTGMLRTQGGDY